MTERTVFSDGVGLGVLVFPEGLADVNADLIGGGLVQAAESGLSGLNDLFLGQGPGGKRKVQAQGKNFLLAMGQGALTHVDQGVLIEGLLGLKVRRYRASNGVGRLGV